MSGCAFYTGVPGWLEVLLVLVQIGFMVTLGVAAITAARAYRTRVELRVAEASAKAAEKSAEKSSAPVPASAAAPAAPSPAAAPASDIDIEPFVD